MFEDIVNDSEREQAFHQSDDETFNIFQGGHSYFTNKTPGPFQNFPGTFLLEPCHFTHADISGGQIHFALGPGEKCPLKLPAPMQLSIKR